MSGSRTRPSDAGIAATGRRRRGRLLGLVVVAVAAEGAALGLDVVRDATPAIAEAGARLEVGLELRNEGPSTWRAEDGYALSYHLLTADGQLVEWDGPRTALPAEVPVGGTVETAARLEVPAATGAYRVVWDVVEEHVRWVSASDPTPYAGAPLEVRPRHRAEIAADSPVWMTAGGRASATVALRNVGALTWPADGTVAVAFHWRAPDGEVLVWDGRRTALPAAVPPDGEVVLEATVEAPPATGRLLLEWDLVHEGVLWFAEADPEPRPRDPVLVVALPSTAAALGVLVALATVALALVERRRGRRPVADLAWLAAVSVAAPAWVIEGTSERLSGSGWCLTVAAAAAVCGAVGLLAVRVRRWTAWLAGCAVVLLAFGDVVHLRFFRDLPSLASLGAAGQLDEVVASIASLIRIGDGWLAVVVACGAAVAVSVRPGAGGHATRPAAAAAVVVAVVAGGVALAGVAAVEQVFRNVYLAREIGVLPYHVVDAVRTGSDAVRRTALGDADRAEVEGWFRRTAPLRAGVGSAFGAARGANLVMIQVESLQSFVVSMEIGGATVTPTLSRWREETAYFPAVTDQTAAGRSSDAELATQASLLPPDRGTAAFRHAGNEYTALASILARHGYTTISAVPFDGGFWNRRATHRAWGFGRSLFAPDFAAGETIGWGLNDRDFLLQMADRLAAAPQPFCAWLLTLSLHHPFEGFPAHLERLDVGPHAGTPFGAYLHTMHLFDGALAAFVARLDELGLSEDTVVVVWGDHDAGFEWTAALATRLGRPHDAAGWYLSQTVPLFVRVPGAAAPTGEHGLPAGHVDVAPTVLALLGIDPAPYALLGRNLLGEPGDEPVVGEYRCWRDRRRLFLQGGPRFEDGRCLDVATLAPLPVAACADGYRAAMTRVAVSDRVLVGDLQRALHGALAASLDGGPSAPLR